MSKLYEAVDSLDNLILNESFDEDAKKLVDYAKGKGYEPYNSNYYDPEKLSIKNEKGDTYNGWELLVQSGEDVLQLTLNGDSINILNLVTGEVIEGKPLTGSVVSSEFSLDLYDFMDFDKSSVEWKAGMKALDIDNLDKESIASIVKQIDSICDEYKADPIKVKSAVFDMIHRSEEYREYKYRSKYEK